MCERLLSFIPWTGSMCLPTTAFTHKPAANHKFVSRKKLQKPWVFFEPPQERNTQMEYSENTRGTTKVNTRRKLREQNGENWCLPAATLLARGPRPGFPGAMAPRLLDGCRGFPGDDSVAAPWAEVPVTVLFVFVGRKAPMPGFEQPAIESRESSTLFSLSSKIFKTTTFEPKRSAAR